MSPHPPRHTHRKRISALRLSSDTTSTLPEYITVGTWQRENDDVPSDKPPDYPDSAEEADADTDSDTNNSPGPAFVYVPPLSPSVVSPRRQRRLTHRRKKSTSPSDPYLDSLLHRSVQALEMSNTLLQSSMSTQTSLSNIFTADSLDEGLESRARGLSMRIQDVGGRSNWQDDLAEITREVEGLFNEDEGRNKLTVPSLSPTAGISSSLPSTSPMPQLYRQRRRPSMLELHNPYDSTPHLQLAAQDRSDLVSPPPRALTQYIASASDPDLITLPSTLGLRAPSTSHLVPLDRRPSCGGGDTSYSHNLHAALSSPQLTDKPIEPSTPAYNMLASLVNRASSSGSSTPSTSLTSTITSPLASFLATSRRNSRTRTSSRSTERGDPRTVPGPIIPDPLKQKVKSPDTNTTSSWSATSTSSTPTINDRSPRSLTPKQILHTLPHHHHHHQHQHRPMTPPTEESSCSSSSEGNNTAKRTILSLRKILDEQPPPPPEPERERPAFLLPRTPAPVPEAGTSTATASISRLFTKAKHSSSTRPPSPPRQSAMKQSTSASSSQQPSPLPSPIATTASAAAAASVPDLLGFVVGRNGSSTSASSSGRSTPKRISFAELPESYSGSKPKAPGGLFGTRRKAGKRRAGAGGVNGKAGLRGGGGRESSAAAAAGGAGWWSGWLSSMGSPSGAGLGVGGPRSYEQTEDRLTRAWGGRMAGAGFGSSTLDEWTV